ncbi:hypothetical protein EXN66_Car010357 [Channa argus]|uniref:Uncharacterized protein n=1 Tax=Channa argus TaxID=215402 RepID=A0A6G1PWG3_CHAAH|nr:hypothetical protein EXN66_Car010357 [Channa argus]
MLPYQCCREKKEGRIEWTVIGPGTDTPNKTKHKLCVEWDGGANHTRLSKHLHFDELSDPTSRIIIKHVVSQRA